MRVYAVIDTNVLVSALLARSNSSPTVKVLDYLFQGLIVAVFNDDIISEYSSVLHREQFGFSEDAIVRVIQAIRTGVSVKVESMNTVLPDPKDVVFYEVAMTQNGSYLVTGNIKHFPKEAQVVTPAEMVAIIEGVFPL